jgi:uncharacterized protein (DUF885 family)
MASADPLSSFSERYLADYLEAHPTRAAGLGFHQYDGRVPDLSRPAIAARIDALRAAQVEIESIDPSGLAGVDWLDYRLLDDAIRLELFDLTEWRRWERDPLTYLGLMEVDQYIKRNYAPLAERVRGLVLHLRAVPQVVATAKANLSEVSAPVLETAVDVLGGGLSFLAEDLSPAVDGLGEEEPALHAEFAAAQALALEAGRDLLDHLSGMLATQPSASFAVGRDAFGKMLRYGEAVDLPLERLLEIGEDDLAKNKRAFVETAARLDPDGTPAAAMARISQEHPTSATLVAETRAMLEELRQFVIDHELVDLPYDERCTVEETPKFMRTAFAMMDTPGPFEPVAREAFYYVTPPEADWPPERQEEWLTAFDYHTLRCTSIHEAWPGHFLHDLHFRDAPSQVAKVFDAYSFWEAWAHYCEEMMLVQGYRAGDQKLRLAQLAGALTRNVRYVCAIGMHTGDMSVEEATARFMRDAFMEETPARAEAVRGTFDPGYLNYTLGKLMLLKLRDDYRAERGEAFDLKRFHDAFLSWGAPPVPYVRRLLLDRDDGQIL